MISHRASALQAQIIIDLSDTATAIICPPCMVLKGIYLILDEHIMNILFLNTNLAKSVGQSMHGSSEISLIETESLAEIPKVRIETESDLIESAP